MENALERAYEWLRICPTAFIMQSDEARLVREGKRLYSEASERVARG
jgi:hypothetical protein